MAGKDFVEIVCRKYCSYFKPSKKEDIACRGFIFIENMAKAGKDVVTVKTERPAQTGRHREEPEGKSLVENLCPPCSFQEEDCDFAAEKEGAPPCGGFILLEILLKKGLADIDDIKNMK
jgi:hypothetical protein